MKRLLPVVLVCCSLLLSGEVWAQGQGWTAFAADTLGPGRRAAVGQLGYPGVSVGLLAGVAERVDVGARLGFNYGLEGRVSELEPGLRLQGWLRVLLAQGERVQLGLTFQPGLLVYFPGVRTRVGMALPLELTVGLPVSSALVLHGALDVPLQVYFGRGGTAVVPVLLGGGAEYFLHRDVALHLTLRMGPSLVTDGGAVDFTLHALLGASYAF